MTSPMGRRRAVLTTSLVAAGVFAAAPGAAPAGERSAKAALSAHIMTVPGDLRWGPCSAALPPGARCAVLEGDLQAADVLFGYRVKLPDGYRIAPHFHPADEHLVIVSGTFHMGTGTRFDADATRALPAGSFAVMPKDAPHFAWTTGETVVHVYAIGPWGLTYVNPGDDPRNATKR